MDWSDAINVQIHTLQPAQIDEELIYRLVRFIDLTSLNDTDTQESIAEFIQKAQTPYGHVAAVCVYPAFVQLVADQYAGSAIQTATVANFPDGADKLEDVLVEIGRALANGAQEVDVVFPYHRYLAGERQYAHTFVEACKAACGENITLKVILETGALIDPAIIADAAYDSFAAGADFIKTSTGKITEGATLEAAATMLLVIKHLSTQVKRPLGLKVSGGVRSLEQAAQYLHLADTIMGKQWASTDTFRIGTSKLIDEINQYSNS